MKSIRITEEDKLKLIEDFKQALEKARMANGKINISKNFGSQKAEGDERPLILYTPEAFVKMDFLVKKFDSEVAWHGLVKRLENRIFLVYDVVMFDQMVTGVTVNTDQEAYTRFLEQLPMETANNMFFHGHSHVNMGVTPSSVDMAHRDEILQTASEDGFWVFQIWNKKGDISTAIYDLAENKLYDDKDVDLQIIFEDKSTSGEFLKNAEEHIKKNKAMAFSKSTYEPSKAFQEYEKKNKKKEGWPKDPDDIGLIDDGTKPYGYNYGYGYGYGYDPMTD